MIRSIVLITVCLFGWTQAGLPSMPGGWRSIDVQSDAIKELASSATEHRNSQINTLYYRNLVEIESARQQVVNGIKYEVTMVLGETHCARTDAGGKLCEVPANSFKEQCVYTFWKAPAEETANVLSATCTDL